MGSEHFVITYIQACTSGKLALSECGPIWQLGIIAALLVTALLVLTLLRMRTHSRPAES